jgi:hypothetical protein
MSELPAVHTASPTSQVRQYGWRCTAPSRTLAIVNKRNLASLLWFLAGWSGGGLLVGIMAWPALLAFIPGIALAILIRLEPARPLWSRSGTGRRIVPINQFAAELDKRAEHGHAAGAETRRV